MMPLHFQLVSVVHHSIGALKGVESGEFTTPSFELDRSYEQLQDSISKALNDLASFDAARLGESKQVIFKIGSREMPFETDTFIKSFSIPNFYFHATTTYDILRMNGAPLGKLDFLGGIPTSG